MNVYVTNPHGFCMGVTRAIKMAEQVKQNNPQRPVAVLGMLVHNEEVINYLQNLGVFTLYNPLKTHQQLLEEVNPDTIIIFTAHGHDKNLEKICAERSITYYDATCSRVTHNHNLMTEAVNQGKQVIYIGQNGHPETTGSLSISPAIILFDMNTRTYIPEPDNSLDTFVINQTTLSILDLMTLHESMKKRFPRLEIADEICPATRLRQEAILNVPKEVDIIYVVGSSKSSNSNKLMDVAKKSHPHILVRMINGKNDISLYDLKNKKLAAVAAGASTPPYVTQEVIDFLKTVK